MIYNRTKLEWIILNVDYIEKVIAYLNFNSQNDVKIMSGYTPSRYNLNKKINNVLTFSTNSLKSPIYSV